MSAFLAFVLAAAAALVVLVVLLLKMWRQANDLRGALTKAQNRLNGLETERQQSEARITDYQKRLEQLAYSDALTAVANRNRFYEEAERVLARAKRVHSHSVVLYCDLDGFKKINDQHGHEAGDVVLVEVARRLEACVRREDLVARMGGDEFAIILENLSDVTKVKAVAESIVERISQPILMEGVLLQVGISVGGVIVNPEAVSIRDILVNADRAMYSAKRQGLGKVVIADFDPKQSL
jgi:diguanylate cyclase (GGDEF)-like protein